MAPDDVWDLFAKVSSFSNLGWPRFGWERNFNSSNFIGLESSRRSNPQNGLS